MDHVALNKIMMVINDLIYSVVEVMFYFKTVVFRQKNPADRVLPATPDPAISGLVRDHLISVPLAAPCHPFGPLRLEP